MHDTQEAEAQLVKQLVETEVPSDIDIIDKKLAVLQKYKA